MRNTSLMASINIMKGIFIFSICMFFLSQALASDVENSVKTYRENLNKVFSCSVSLICFDRILYRKDMNDFTLIFERKVDKEFNRENYKAAVNGRDMMLSLLREKLTLRETELSTVLTSKNNDIDEMIRGNLNIVLVYKYLSSYFLAVSTKDGKRRFRFDIRTQEELDYYINEYLQDTLD